ncbi:MAG: helix-turn-helix domain-containing protein, partial [Gammaproteobacteria bacterium]|nr:helix-turn-helix domain-containing protein [Gammaproteobacteria bacterium]
MLKTLNLKEAAQILKMTPEGLRRKISRGEIPAAKIGKLWIFIKTDLVEYMR